MSQNKVALKNFTEEEIIELKKNLTYLRDKIKMN